MLTRTEYVTMTLEEVSQLRAGDVDAYGGNDSVSVADSGPHLAEYYETTPRYNYRGGVCGMFWDKVQEVVDILLVSHEWPFEPLTVGGDTLYDGHHRANAAIIANWDKPIPVEPW
ncbi:hypothetical protein [Mycolicibacterium aichiense]|nr:hypothetical protein [Mycolicibacterium aichiense]